MSYSPTILVIDPEKGIRRALSKILRNQGFHIKEAVSGQEGLDKASTCQPDLIILNTELADMDGIDLTEEIRRRSGLPILIISACQDEQEIVRALDSGADDYIVKPFYPKELLARVRVALRRIGWRWSEGIP
jgi:DNA-binding response OmpR family regulator